MARDPVMPTSKMGRSAVIGGAAARVGVKKAVHYTKRPFLSPEKRLLADDNCDADVARIIFDALSMLRGTALKAAQLVAMEIEMLPEAYRSELARSASDVPPMNRALVGKILRRELGCPGDVFAHFEMSAFAAASLGQVHAATTNGGRRVAVKLQYPGLAEGVTADLEMLKRVLGPTKYHRVFADCFPEVERKVLEELDYRKEARYTTWFHELEKDGEVVLPEVLPSLSTARVLTTSRLSGQHLRGWLASNPSKAARDHFGQRLVDFMNRSLFTHRTLHADPNPGNYLFRDDGRLGVIDFGCVVTLDPAFVDAVAGLLRCDDHFDARVEEALHNAAGIHYREGREEAFVPFFKSWVRWLKEPFHPEGYDFGRNRDYFDRGNAFFDAYRQYIDHYDSCFIYFGRTLHGIMRILQQLGARVKMAPPV